MRGVHVEVSAAVCAQHLDGELRCQGALLDCLSAAFQRLHGSGGFEVLNRSLRNEEQGGNYGNGQKNVQRTPSHIDPEVSYGLSGMPGKTAYQSYRNCNPNGRRYKILHGEPRHLNEVADRKSVV